MCTVPATVHSACAHTRVLYLLISPLSIRHYTTLKWYAHELFRWISNPKNSGLTLAPVSVRPGDGWTLRIRSSWQWLCGEHIDSNLLKDSKAEEIWEHVVSPRYCEDSIYLSTHTHVQDTGNIKPFFSLVCREPEISKRWLFARYNTIHSIGKVSRSPSARFEHG